MGVAIYKFMVFAQRVFWLSLLLLVTWLFGPRLWYGAGQVDWTHSKVDHVELGTHLSVAQEMFAEGDYSVETYQSGLIWHRERDSNAPLFLEFKRDKHGQLNAYFVEGYTLQLEDGRQLSRKDAASTAKTLLGYPDYIYQESTGEYIYEYRGDDVRLMVVTDSEQDYVAVINMRVDPVPGPGISD